MHMLCVWVLPIQWQLLPRKFRRAGATLGCVFAFFLAYLPYTFLDLISPIDCLVSVNIPGNALDT